MRRRGGGRQGEGASQVRGEGTVNVCRCPDCYCSIARGECKEGQLLPLQWETREWSRGMCGEICCGVEAHSSREHGMPAGLIGPGGFSSAGQGRRALAKTLLVEAGSPTINLRACLPATSRDGLWC